MQKAIIFHSNVHFIREHNAMFNDHWFLHECRLFRLK
jgi:hypothetical protein